MSGPSFGMLVVTHGRLAEDLVSAVSRIVGDLEQLAAISMDWNDPVDAATERIRRGVEQVDRGSGVLILTDMFGGTPTNLALSLLEPGRVENVTGVNLPMLVKFANLRGEIDLAEAAAIIARQGRDSIRVASEVLDGGEGRTDS